MLKNYILITLRNFGREKVYALINILGLSLALACCVILVLYIRSELTYDKHYEDYQRIGRVVNEFNTNGQSLFAAATSPALGPLVAKDYPQVGEFVRFQPLSRGVGGQTMLKTEGTEIFWNNVYIVDENLFDVFSHEVIYGELDGALKDPSSIAISETVARSYWGDANPVGETLSTDTFQYRVTAVFADLPDNTHLKYNAVLSRNRLATFGQTDDNFSPQNLHGINEFCYFKVPEGTTLSELERILNEYYNNNAAEIGRQFGTYVKYTVQPLADVHFQSNWDYDEPTGNIFYVYGFTAVAIFILLVACINYTNLAIARATKRSKEIGMRKVIGAGKTQLIFQFIGESLFYTLLAFCLGLVFIELIERYTSLPSLLGKTLLLDFQTDPLIVVWLAAAAFIVGVAAGIYPAFYLSSISPLAALTAVKRGKASKFSIREILVFVQFFVSIAVVACTLLMAMQMRYISSKPLGFDKENRIFVQLRGVDVLEKLPVIRNELLNHSSVLGVAESSFTPGNPIGVNLMSVETNDGQMEPNSVWNMAVSKEFFDVMGMEIVEGRDFSTRLLTDVGLSVIVNQTLVDRMGWDNPLGKKIGVGNSEARVIGVVNDFHFASLRQSVEPMLMRLFPPQDFSNVPAVQRNIISRPIVINLARENLFQAINHVESVMNQFDPRHPFEFTFFEDSLNQLYLSETNLMKLTGIFSGICIFISCMGLFGLSAFNTEQRTKEIGVRKVLGASTGQIIFMLSKGQLMLIGIAAVLASVVSYLAINNWLTAFSYHTDIAYWVFVVSALAVAAVAFITIALQSSKTAQSNPVNALRYE